MASFIITYDLVNGRDYESIYTAIKSLGRWARVTESVWVITSDEDCISIRDKLLQHMDDDDRLFVTKSSSVAAWKNTRCSSEWLKNNL